MAARALHIEYRAGVCGVNNDSNRYLILNSKRRRVILSSVKVMQINNYKKHRGGSMRATKLP